MGRMLDALRRIEAEQATARSGQAVQEASPASSVPEHPAAERADSPSSVSRPMAIPVAPNRFGLFQPTGPCECRSPTRAAAAHAGRGRPAERFQVAQSSSRSASRWWKTPPCPTTAPAGEKLPVEDDAASSPPEASTSDTTATPEPPAVADHAEVSSGVPTASADLISRLLEEYPPGRSAVVLLCDPGLDDVTFALASLAVALASQTADPILAVDATFRGEGLQQLAAKATEADPRPRPGWLEVLGGQGGWEQATLGTNLANLTVLCGPDDARRAQAASVAVSSDRWTAALRQWRARYRFVLMGVAPGEDAVTARLAREADAVYLVIRPGRTGRRAANSAVQSFRRQGGRVAGCILVTPRGQGGV